MLQLKGMCLSLTYFLQRCERGISSVIYPEHFKLTETLNNPTHPQDKKKHEQ